MALSLRGESSKRRSLIAKLRDGRLGPRGVAPESIGRPGRAADSPRPTSIGPPRAFRSSVQAYSFTRQYASMALRPTPYRPQCAAYYHANTDTGRDMHRLGPRRGTPTDRRPSFAMRGTLAPPRQWSCWLSSWRAFSSQGGRQVEQLSPGDSASPTCGNTTCTPARQIAEDAGSPTGWRGGSRLWVARLSPGPSAALVRLAVVAYSGCGPRWFKDQRPRRASPWTCATALARSGAAR